MRYRSLCLLFFMLASISLLFAQECNFPLPPSNICANAPLLCDLDGYCSDNTAATDSGTPNAFCGIVENNNWVAFLAGSETFTLELTVSGCNIGTGLQAQILSTNNCQTFTSVSNCIDPAVTSATLTATNLVIGQRYYLMIDGKGGDVCDYSLRLLEGETLSPANAVIEPAGALCEGEEVVLSAVGISTNPDLTYQWTSPDGNILSGEDTDNILINAPGQYQVNISDAGGCTDSSIINVPLEPLPQFSIAEPDTLNCLTDLQVLLQATPNDPSDIYGFEWTTPNGLIIAGENTAVPTVGQAGTYFVTATDLISGCSSNQNVLVVADADTPVANIVGDVELNCLVDTITLSSIGSSVGASFTYRWETMDGVLLSGSNLPEAILATPGTYSLTVRNEDNGCEAVANQLVILNDAEPESARLIILEPCFEVADGEVLIEEVFGGTPPYDFGLSQFGTPVPFQDLPAGSYEFAVTDAIGCSWDTTIVLTEQAEFLIDAGPDIITRLGCEIAISVQTNRPAAAIEQVRWEPEVGCQDCLDFELLALNSALYEVSLRDVNGCAAETQIRITVEKGETVYIPNAFSPNGDGRNDVFYIQSGKAVEEVLFYEIYDRWGSLVAAQSRHLPDDPAFGWDGDFDGKPAANGIYLYQTSIQLLNGAVENWSGDVLLIR